MLSVKKRVKEPKNPQNAMIFTFLGQYKAPFRCIGIIKVNRPEIACHRSFMIAPCIRYLSLFHLKQQGVTREKTT